MDTQGTQVDKFSAGFSRRASDKKLNGQKVHVVFWPATQCDATTIARPWHCDNTLVLQSSIQQSSNSPSIPHLAYGTLYFTSVEFQLLLACWRLLRVERRHYFRCVVFLFLLRHFRMNLPLQTLISNRTVISLEASSEFECVKVKAAEIYLGAQSRTTSTRLIWNTSLLSFVVCQSPHHASQEVCSSPQVFSEIPMELVV